MRRYGNAGYGGPTNAYPDKQQPRAFEQFPPRRMDVTRQTPPDVQPRRPSTSREAPPVELEKPAGGIFDAESFIEDLLYRLKTEFHPYNAYDALRYASFKSLALFVGTMDTIVLEKATDIRVYLFLINTHPVNDLFLTFQTTATPLLGVPISPSRGFYEFVAPVPQDSIHLVASAAGTTGVLVFAEVNPAVLNRQPGPI